MPTPRLVAGASAAATAVLLFAAHAIAPDGPDEATASAQQITRFVGDSAGSIRVSLCLTALAAAALLVFAAAVTSQLRAGGAELAARIAPCAATATAALIAASAAVRTPLVRESSAAAGDVWLQAVYSLEDLADALGDLAVVTAAVLVASLAFPALRGHGLPRPLGAIGVLLAAAGALAALAPLDGVDDGPFTIALALFYVLWPVWLLAVGITFAVRASGSRYPSEPGYQQAAV